jgi:undecaprenyl-diphosphatase
MAPFDTAIFHALNRGAANRLFDAVFPVLTGLHQQSWFLAGLAVLSAVALWRGDRRIRLWVVAAILAVGFSDVLCSKAIKRAFVRERPCQAVARLGTPDGGARGVRVVNPDRCPGSPSFPSNHAANMMAVGSVCWYFTRRRTRWAWFALPLVIGYTRVYLGYHYPTDVIGGWAVGAAVAGLVLAPLTSAVRGSPSPDPRP